MCFFVSKKIKANKSTWLEAIDFGYSCLLIFLLIILCNVIHSLVSIIFGLLIDITLLSTLFDQ
jgi:hypothetical protein